MAGTTLPPGPVVNWGVRRRPHAPLHFFNHDLDETRVTPGECESGVSIGPGELERMWRWRAASWLPPSLLRRPPCSPRRGGCGTFQASTDDLTPGRRCPCRTGHPTRLRQTSRRPEIIRAAVRRGSAPISGRSRSNALSHPAANLTFEDTGAISRSRQRPVQETLGLLPLVDPGKRRSRPALQRALLSALSSEGRARPPAGRTGGSCDLHVPAPLRAAADRSADRRALAQNEAPAFRNRPMAASCRTWRSSGLAAGRPDGRSDTTEETVPN